MEVALGVINDAIAWTGEKCVEIYGVDCAFYHSYWALRVGSMSSCWGVDANSGTDYWWNVSPYFTYTHADRDANGANFDGSAHFFLADNSPKSQRYRPCFTADHTGNWYPVP